MSSGTVKNNYNENITIDVSNQTFSAPHEKKGQKSKFGFLTELVTFLFTKRNTEGCYKIISDLISLSFNLPQHLFENLPFSEYEIENCNSIANHFTLRFTSTTFENKNQILSIINRIRTLFTGCTNLTIQQKFDFCSIERYFMKQYLKLCI